MAKRAHAVLAVGAALLAVACGTVTSGTANSGTATSGTATSGTGTSGSMTPGAAASRATETGTPATPPPAAPAVTVTPDSALAGGQQLRVTLTGFPPDAIIELYECAGPGTCYGSASYALTGSAGSASATFTAQPSVRTSADPGATPTPCGRRQCDLVAVAVKKARGGFPKPAPTATARLTFAATPAAVANLADATLLDTSWVSATEGWALAVQPCAAGDCTRVARTTDGGQHWQALPDPPTVQEGDYGCPDLACAGHVTFASPQVGYLYGPALLMTTDGGRHWHPQPGPLTETLTVAGGTAYRVAYDHTGCPGPCQPSLQEAPAGSAHWRTLAGQLTEPGRSGSAQIAVSGPDVLLALYGSLAGPFPATAVVYRSADGGGSWQRAEDPCTSGSGQEQDLTGLAAAPGGFFAGVCAVRASLRDFVITSADAGVTWHATPATPPPAQWDTLVATASQGTIALASGPSGGNGKDSTTLFMTTDGGGQWVTAATDPQDLGGGASIPPTVSFETPLAGQWLGDAHGIWTTADGGLHWTRTAFR